MVLVIRNAKTLTLGVGLYQSEANNEAEYTTSEEERNCLAAEAAGEGEKLESEVTEDGSF